MTDLDRRAARLNIHPNHKYMFALLVDEMAGLGRHDLQIRTPGAGPLEAGWRPQRV